MAKKKPAKKSTARPAKPAPRKASTGKPAARSKSSAQPRSSKYDTSRRVVGSLEKLAAIQARYDKKITRPNQELKSIKRELDRLRAPLYKLNREEKAVKGRGSKAKKAEIQAQRETYLALIQGEIDALTLKRQDVRSITKLQDDIKAVKKDIRKDIKDLDKKLREADKKKDKKEFNRLLDEKERLITLMDGVLEATDQVKKAADFSGFKQYEGEGEGGFVEEPTSPMPVWEAQEYLAAYLASGDYDWYVINGVMIAVENEGAIQAEFDQLRYYIDEQKNGPSETPRVRVFRNDEERIAKFTAEF